MRFKEWFLEFGLAAATSLIHGGLVGDPGDGIGNTRMPYGVRSKTMAMDRPTDKQQDPDADKVDPDITFGYTRRPLDKKGTMQRKAKTTSINTTGVPLRMNVPDIPR